MRKANIIVYVAFGAIAIVYGLVAVLFPARLLSEASRSIHLAHILREQGAAGIFIGLMGLWCIFNYERRRAVHYFLMVFAFLLAVIHWVDFFNSDLPWLSPVYNSIPFTALLVMAVLSRRIAGASDSLNPS